MILIIPAIDLSGSQCVRRTGDKFTIERTFFRDPVKMAKLWRVQNARLLHLTSQAVDDSSRRIDAYPDEALLSRICEAVDIPVQLHASFQSMEDIEKTFESGIGRIILEVNSKDRLDFFSEVLTRFGQSRIVAGIHACAGVIDGGEGISAVEIGLNLERMNCRRIVYTDIIAESSLERLDFKAVESLASNLSRTRISVAGGIGGYEDLKHLAEIEKCGVDSVIIGRALYENRFACQICWCWNQKENVDLDRFSTAEFSGNQE
jgi:phosphoribosylformimino-5-aminoimidazole carboxamide ribotide isomerase